MHRLLTTVVAVFLFHAVQSQMFRLNSVNLGLQKVAAPTRCCAADKYEMKVSSVSCSEYGDMCLRFFVTRLSVDFKQRMVSVDVLVIGKDGESNLTLITDYSQNMYYVITNVGKLQKCEKDTYPGPMGDRCIPEDAKYGGSVKIGNGAFALNADNWLVTRLYGNSQGNVSASSLVQSDGCILVAEKEVYDKGIDTALYYDYSLGIKDPSVFDVPSSCRNASVMDIPGLPSITNFFLRKYSK